MKNQLQIQSIAAWDGTWMSNETISHSTPPPPPLGWLLACLFPDRGLCANAKTFRFNARGDGRTDRQTDMVVRSLNGCAFPFYNNDGFAFQPPQLGHGVDDYEEEMTTMEKDAG